LLRLDPGLPVTGWRAADKCYHCSGSKEREQTGEREFERLLNEFWIRVIVWLLLPKASGPTAKIAAARLIYSGVSLCWGAGNPGTQLARSAN